MALNFEIKKFRGTSSVWRMWNNGEVLRFSSEYGLFEDFSDGIIVVLRV